MALTAAERQVIVTDLITNCACWKHDGSKDMLNKMSDEQLAAIKADQTEKDQAFAVANRAIDGVKVGDKHVKLNPKTSKWEAAIVSNEDTIPTTPATGSKEEGKGSKSKKDQQKPVGNADPDDDDEDDEEVTRNRKGRKKRVRTFDELLRDENIDPALAEQINNMKQVETREKVKVIEQLLANCSNQQERRVHQDRLMHRSLQELYADLDMLPKMAPMDDEQARQQAQRVANENRRRQASDDDMLVPPSMNYRELDETGNVRGEATQAVGNGGLNLMTDNSHDDGGSVDDELSGLSPRMRAIVQNAQVVVDKERRNLIAQLTANLDEAEEKRVTRSLGNLTVEQLRDLAHGLGQRRERQPVNYFGGNTTPMSTNAGAGNGNGRGNQNFSPDDDLLELPSMPYQEDTAMKKFKSA